MANEYISTAMYTAMQTAARKAIEGCGSSISVSVTYTRKTARTFAPTTGQTTATSADTAVTAHRLTKGTESENRTEGAKVEGGPVSYLVEKRRLAFEPSKHDRITEGTDTYEVLEYSQDGASLFWVFRCKRIGV